MGSIVELNPATLNGNWMMDKKISDDIGPILKLQGIGWLVRKAICAATMIINFADHKDDESGNAYLSFDQTLKGIYTVPEKRMLDWAEHDHADDVFGEAFIKSRLISGEKAEDGRLYTNVELQTTIEGNSKAEAEAKSWLRIRALPDKVQGGKQENVYVHDYLRSKTNGWTMEQVWGVENINGKQYLTRHAVVVKGSSYEFRRCFYGLMEEQDTA